jgi:hypothetical protein
MGGRGRVAFISKNEARLLLGRVATGFTQHFKRRGLHAHGPDFCSPGGKCFALLLAGKFLRSAGYSFNRPHPAAYSY